MTKKAILSLILLCPLIASSREVIIGYQVINQPRQKCWNEQVIVQRQPNYGGLILGGIAGGLLGNQIGRGHGREAATAIGAVTGSVVGDNLSDHQNAYRTVQHCQTVYEQVEIPIYGHEDNHWYRHGHHHEHQDRD